MVKRKRPEQRSSEADNARWDKRVAQTLETLLRVALGYGGTVHRNVNAGLPAAPDLAVYELITYANRPTRYELIAPSPESDPDLPGSPVRPPHDPTGETLSTPSSEEEN